jgi:uncharacterized protein (DUF433 family)
MAAAPRIAVNPRVLAGKPVIAGTRISVELILRDLAEGATVEDLLEAYPQLCDADVRAAIAYAADSISAEQTVAVAVAAPRKPRR